MALDRTDGATLALATAVALAVGSAAWPGRGSRAEGQGPADRAVYETILTEVLAVLRAQQWDYWTTHWQLNGEPFYGDHLLFERLYTGPLTEQIDQLAEKIVAAFGSSAVDADPSLERTHHHVRIWAGTRCPYERALRAERALQAAIWRAYEIGKQRRLMTLGMDDFLMALANQHETNIYLLKQRLEGVVARGSKAHSDQRGARAMGSPGDLYEVLAGLLEWESQMGGWSAPIWPRARKLRERLRTKAISGRLTELEGSEMMDVLLKLIYWGRSTGGWEAGAWRSAEHAVGMSRR